jgi:prolipoprotein diacylglyceryltransferase
MSALLGGWFAWFAGALSRSPHQALSPREWGLGSLGLVLGMLVQAWRSPESRTFLRAAAPSLAFGLAIARLGCFSAGCDFGEVSTAEWVARCDPSARDGTPTWGLHPFALYSAVWFGVGGGLFLRARGRPRTELFVVTLWLAGAWGLEFFRHPRNLPPVFAGLNVAQGIAVLGLLACSLAFATKSSTDHATR